MPGGGLGRQVDQHDVLEGRGQDQGLAERVDGPRDDLAGRCGLELPVELGQLLECSASLVRHRRLGHGASSFFLSWGTGRPQ